MSDPIFVFDQSCLSPSSHSITITHTTSKKTHIKIYQWQADQQQQGGPLNAPSATLSTAAASRMKMSNDLNSSPPGSQGGARRTEPPRSRSAHPVPPTITPSESASNIFNPQSVRSATQGSFGGSQSSSRRPPSMPAHQYPASAAQYSPAGSFIDRPGQSYVMPRGSNVQSPPTSFTPSQQRSIRSNAPPPTVRQPPPAPSTTSQQRSARSNAGLSAARASDNHAFGGPQNTSSNVASRAMGRTPSRVSPQTYAGGLVGGPQPAGISIGASPYGPVNLRYDQVDNRQVTINNNAPGNITTHNNNASNVDNSNHHNTNSPQANTYHNTLTNVGNAHINVRQRATAARNSAPRGTRPPREVFPRRTEQY